MSEFQDVLSTRGAAKLLGVSIRTVQRLVADETLRPAYRMDGQTGAFLFWEDEIRNYAERRGSHAA